MSNCNRSKPSSLVQMTEEVDGGRLVQFDQVWESIYGVGKPEGSHPQNENPPRSGGPKDGSSVRRRNSLDGAHYTKRRNSLASHTTLEGPKKESFLPMKSPHVILSEKKLTKEDPEITLRTGSRSIPIPERAFPAPKRRGFFSFLFFRNRAKPHLLSFESLTRQRFFGEIIARLSDDRINKAQWLKCRGYDSPLHFLLLHRPPLDVVNTLILELKALGVTCPEAVTDSKGRNSIHIACSVSPSNSISVIARLVNGQTIVSPINPCSVTDHCKMLPIHHACKASVQKADIEKRVLIIQFLAEFYPPGALAVNHRGLTPSDLVRKHSNNPEILMVLYKAIVDQRRYINTAAFIGDSSMDKSHQPIVQAYTRSEHRRGGGLAAYLHNNSATCSNLSFSEANDMDSALDVDGDVLAEKIYPSRSDLMMLDDDISELGSMYTSGSTSLCRTTESALEAVITSVESKTVTPKPDETVERRMAVVDENAPNADSSQDNTESTRDTAPNTDSSNDTSESVSEISSSEDLSNDVSESVSEVCTPDATLTSPSWQSQNVKSSRPALTKKNSLKMVQFSERVEVFREGNCTKDTGYEQVDLDLTDPTESETLDDSDRGEATEFVPPQVDDRLNAVLKELLSLEAFNVEAPEGPSDMRLQMAPAAPSPPLVNLYFL
jgi:hypothetical protein